MKKGILICVSGFSGAGKGTLMKALLEKYPNYALSISATTRSPRPGEIDKKDYFFKTKDEFEEMIKNDEFLEYAQYVDNYYGTPKSYVYEQLEKGKDVILEIEVQGVFKVKEKYPDTVLVFVATPSIDEIRERLIKRGTETPEKIEKRMSQIAREVKSLYDYDYILVNENNKLDECVEKFNHIIESIHQKTDNSKDLINKLETEAEEITK
jgi:guanylate kinase